VGGSPAHAFNQRMNNRSRGYCKRNRHVEHPGPPDFDHVVLTRQGRREAAIRRLAVDHLADRVVDRGHAARHHEAHLLHRAVGAHRHRHHRLRVRLLHRFAHHVEGHVHLDLAAHGLRILHEIGVGVGAPEQPAAAQAAGRGRIALGGFLLHLLADRPQALLAFRFLLGALALRLVLFCLRLPRRLLLESVLARGFLPDCLLARGFLPDCLLARGLQLRLFLARRVELRLPCLFLPCLFLPRRFLACGLLLRPGLGCFG